MNINQLLTLGPEAAHQWLEKHKDELALIPLDHSGNPDISSEMKFACLGEYSLSQERDCPDCTEDDQCDDCPICHGEIHYTEKHQIPWTISKDIYQDMASIGIKKVSDEIKKGS